MRADREPRPAPTHSTHPAPTLLRRLISDLEASKVAAVKSVGDLQKRLATEHGQMLKLQGELSRARSDLKASQSEVEKEKTALVAAKKQAADAAEAARAAELALRGQAGLESLKSPLGLAATSGWTLAAIVAVTKNKKEDRDGSLVRAARTHASEAPAALAAACGRACGWALAAAHHAAPAPTRPPPSSPHPPHPPSACSWTGTAATRARCGRRWRRTAPRPRRCARS